MTSSSNKLVDKYQYNDSQIRQQGLVQLITAKHIVLKQLFTLKKICINNPKTVAKYNGVINQMNILKTLNDSSMVLKCHKMLKTANNLYIVYDLMGKYPTLDQLIEKNLLNEQTKKKSIALQILKFLKYVKSLNVLYLDLSTKLIEVDVNEKIKFINFENAIFSDKNASSFTFLNISVSSDLAPQLKQFIQNVATLTYQKEIDSNLFSERLSKVDVFAYGKILEKIFAQELDYQNIKTEKEHNGLQSFELSLMKIISKMFSEQPAERPSFEEIEVLFQPKTQQLRRLKIKISPLERKPQDIRQSETELKKSRSVLKSSKLTTVQFLSPSIAGQDDFDKKSIRSSGQFTDSTSKSHLKKRKGSFANIQSEQSNQQAYKLLVLKIIKRRTLCKFLLKLANIVFSLPQIDQNQRVMLSFFLIKKSVLLICSLARYISTGKGQREQFDLKDLIRKQFSKTNDFFKLSVSINKQMDAARNLYQGIINIIQSDFSQIVEMKEFNFAYESKSQNLNEKLMKQLVRKLIVNILKRIQSSPKSQQLTKKPQINYLSPSQSQNRLLTISRRSTNKQNLDVCDITSVRSAKTIRTNLSGSTNNQKSVENCYQTEQVLRNLSFQTLIYVYLMGLILDFQTYEKMFQNLVGDEAVQFQEQSLFKKLKKMEPKLLAYKMHQIVA